MKRLLIYFSGGMVILLFGVLSSCHHWSEKESKQNPDSVYNAKRTIAKEDSGFMVQAANGGMMEVKMGKTASQKSNSKQVRAFGEMMIQDHGKFNSELKKLAKQKGVALSDTLSQKESKNISRLNDKESSGFDRDYINLMVKDHKKDVDMFTNAEYYVKDSDLKSFIHNALPVLKMHLDSAEAIQKRVDKSPIKVPETQVVH